MKLIIPTTLGNFLAHYSNHGLAQLDFPNAHRQTFTIKNAITEPSPQIQLWHKLTSRALHDALAGREPRELPPLDLASGTDFQRQVWSALRQIAPGKTKSYAEVAAKIGRPKATRAVGNACGANPVPVLVPCHRVLAANHRLGGFSSGLDWKRKLLALESVH